MKASDLGENFPIEELQKSHEKEIIPFSRLLVGEPGQTKRILQEELRAQGIQFDFFKKKSGYNPDTGHNRTKFNGRCPAFIQFLTTNGFIENDESWQNNIELYLKETENYIDPKKLTDGYLNDNKIYSDTQRTLNQIDITSLKNKIQTH